MTKRKNRTDVVGNTVGKPTRNRRENRFAAVLSLAGFLASLTLIALFLWNVDSLARLGLTGLFYYLILVMLGLVPAAFLFGALHSFAKYTGHHFGGVLELGGAVVAWALVIFGGVQLGSPSNFDLTVFVHGKEGPQDLLLRNQGHVLIDLGKDRRREPIREKGQATFSEIPASFLGQKVNVFLDTEGYELAETSSRRILRGTQIYLTIRRKSQLLTGYVQDEKGGLISGALITVSGLKTVTDPLGHFELMIPGNLLKPELMAQVLATGYAPWRGTAVPGSNALTVILKRAQP